jgi:hypothetical protein
MFDLPFASLSIRDILCVSRRGLSLSHSGTEALIRDATHHLVLASSFTEGHNKSHSARHSSWQTLFHRSSETM